MRVEILTVDDQKKIQAIKCIRAASGLGLKEAKDLADDVASGRPQFVEVTRNGLVALDEGYLTYRQAIPDITTADFVEVLSRYPRNLNVGDVLDVLVVVRDLEAAASKEKETHREPR